MGQLIASIPRTDAGNLALRHLQERGEPEFRISYVESLSDRLRRGRRDSASSVDRLNESFHLLTAPDGLELVSMIRVLQFHNQLEPAGSRGKVDSVEVDLPAALSAPSVQLDPTNHQANLAQLNIASARANGITGQNVRVAIVDTGADGVGFIHDFHDLLSTANPHPGRFNLIDNHGHGTTMATIIHEVAPDAEIHVVRITDRGIMSLWDILAGICVAAIDCAADITNLSLGADLGGSPCFVCGSLAQVRSLAIEKLIDALAQWNPARPVWVAAVGNGGLTNGFEYPAAYQAVMAAGSVNTSQYRSQFSNCGTAGHPYYLMAPGGETTPDRLTVTEPVDSVNGTDHAGTSEATAYTSGVLALLRSETIYRNKSRTDFLDAVIQNHCVAPSHTNPPPPDYGAGLIRYSHPVQTAAGGLTTQTAATGSGTGQIIDQGDHISINGFDVPKPVVVELLRDITLLKTMVLRRGNV